MGNYIHTRKVDEILLYSQRFSHISYISRSYADFDDKLLPTINELKLTAVTRTLHVQNALFNVTKNRSKYESSAAILFK